MFCVALLAVLFVLAAVSCVVTASTAEARPHARSHQSAQHHVARRHHVKRPRRHHARSSRSVRIQIVSHETSRSVRGFFESLAPSPDRVSAARAYLGRSAAQLGLPRRLWCADFINLLEHRLGRRGTGSRLAMSFASYGRRVSAPVAGAIVTMSRRGGGHVGVVSGVTADGDPVVISGNGGGGIVTEKIYPRSRIRSYSL